MRNLILLLVFLSFSSIGRGQFFTYYLEPFGGFSFSRYLKGQEPPIRKDGGALLYGLKGTVDFSGYFSINLTGGIGSSNYNDNFFQLGVNVPFYRVRDAGLTFFVEGGIELTEDGDAKTPIYFGVKKQLDKRFAFMTRLRPPTGLDTHYLDFTDTFFLGVEFGLRVRLWANPYRKPITKFGNPFTLG